MKPEKMVEELTTALGKEVPADLEGDAEGSWMYLLGVATAMAHPLDLGSKATAPEPSGGLGPLIEAFAASIIQNGDRVEISAAAMGEAGARIRAGERVLLNEKPGPRYAGVDAAFGVPEGIRLGVRGLPPHLRDDTPPLCECDRCGRESWSASEISKPCLMPQPADNVCGGTMRPRVSAMDLL